MGESLRDFFDNFSFDSLIEFLSNAGPDTILESNVVMGIGIVLLGLMAYPKTRNLGSWIAVRGGIAFLYTVGGIVLKNSDISTPGPFIIAMTMGSGIVGYVIWTKMIMTN